MREVILVTTRFVRSLSRIGKWVMKFQQKSEYTIDDLLQLMRILRAPDGCPWDKRQTHQSIRRNFIEETYEVAEAIDACDSELLKEELGDVLLQVVFHAQMEAENGAFNFDDVADGICKKLIARHPHIFSDVIAETPQEVLRNWDEIKRRQKGQQTCGEVLNSVPKTLPSLMRSEKVQYRAAKAGFDYPDLWSAFSDMRSEVEELDKAVRQGEPGSIEEELGDLLFSVVNVARFLDLDPENALTKACDKFISRFAQVERLALERGVDMKSAGIEMLDVLWGEVKNKES